MMTTGAIPALATVLLLVFAAPTLDRSAQVLDGPAIAGESGPSAAGAPVNLHQLPLGSQRDGPALAREIPRRYPVDQATFERLKGQANAEAAADAMPEEDVP